MRARRPTKGKGDSDVGPTEAEQSADIMARAILGAENPSDGILAAEAQGQTAFVREAVLPSDGLKDSVLPDGLVVEGKHDDLFVKVTLPEGWSKKASPGHSMWSYLLDGQGRQRAAIFYKAAFYDRSAHLDWSTRYGIRTRYLDDGGRVQVVVTDAPAGVDEEGPVLWESEIVESYDDGGKARKAALAWLDERRPDWRNPMAYWDDVEVLA